MKKFYTFFVAIPLLIAVVFGLYSLVDKDDEISASENRGLAQKPKFSLSAIFDGTYMQEMETYYTDQFPLRENLMPLNKSLNSFYYFSGGSDDSALIIETTGNAGAGGIGMTQGESETEEEETGTQMPDPTTGESTPPEDSQTTAPEKTEEPVEEEEEIPELDNPANAETVNQLLVVGDRAMELVYGNETLMQQYAEAVNSLADVLPGVNTYSLVTPNSTQFYGPESVRSGNTDQEAMIQTIYSHLDDKVTAVDAYTQLRNHVDEYIFFRADHHWTQLGAYYAYTAFCEAAGMEALDLDEFETGLVTCSSDGSQTFLGTLYRNVKDYPQGDAIAANPDSVTYYMPTVKTDATAYTSLENGELYGGYNGITTVAKTVGDPYLYMAFIGGDQPIEVIETDVDNDKVCMVLKESYGNAFVPFLTNHYSKVVVVDPRKFNTSDTPVLYLPDLAQLTGVTDLIVINYPHMPNNEYFITRLNRLAGN